MPTPFYHLSIAESILAHPDLPTGIRSQLEDQRCSFMLGHTAPDVQVASGQERHETHFFTIPILPGMELPWLQLFHEYPYLADPAHLPTDQAAFISGYLCHLQADWIWILDIYGPKFSTLAEWSTRSHRAYIHNVMRTYLDLQAYESLPKNTGECLDSVNPHAYLPFTEDRFIREWSRFLADQLKPGGMAQTIEVFSRRQGLSPQNFYDLLGSDERMDSDVFSHISKKRLEEFRDNLIEENIQLIISYLDGYFHSTQI